MEQAWAARARALTRANRRVGAAVISSDGRVFVGCNIQQKYHTSDLHAEVVAISSMISAGSRGITAMAIASDRAGIPPCGACLDWILEFGGERCVIIWKGEELGSGRQMTAGKLLPHHPPYH